MRGIVRRVSRANGFAAIETSAGDYTVAELLGGELEPRDQAEGDLQSLGGRTLRKLPSGQRLSVFIRDCYASAARAGELLGPP
jgi:hypothetical protein